MKRHYFIPEVIQTSAMDCGPAALKALFAGFGRYLSYGRLREACQTDVDGTSIDTLEEVAQCLGLDVQQRMLPTDLLLLESSASLPAIVVTRLPGGAAHFVVLWRVHRSRVQVMDPAGGRVWMPCERFIESLFIHEQTVARSDWDEWAQSPEFSAGIRARLGALRAEACWSDPAHLDAALRLAEELRRVGALQPGVAAQSFLELCRANPEQIPPQYWCARDMSGDQVRLRGTVLLSAAGLRSDVSAELPESLLPVLNEPPPRAWTTVFDALCADGYWLPLLIAGAVALTAVGSVLEGLLFTSVLELSTHLRLAGERLVAIALAIAFVATLLVLEWSAARGLMHLGRRLELRLRARFLAKVPALSDRYFRARLISDMAYRAHALHLMRELPALAGSLVHSVASLLIAATAVTWLFPQAAPLAWLAVSAAVGVPLAFHNAFVERDLRLREVGGSLSRFYLDALLGARAIHAHGAQRALMSAHAFQLADWTQASLRQHVLIVGAEVAQLALCTAPIIWLVYSQALLAGGAAGLLLLMYWVWSIPLAGRQLAWTVWSAPTLRNTVLRCLEPLSAPEQNDIARAAGSSASPPTVSSTAATAPTVRAAEEPGVSISIQGVTAVAAGHVILDRVSLEVEAGEHVGVIGASGAGKSALVGLLLGWHRPAEGRVEVDGAVLNATGLARLRRETAWIDPQVHLFNASLLDNVSYGNGAEATAARLESIVEEAGLLPVLEHLPDGLQTVLGEGGALIAGGEGQRVRIGRGLGRRAVRLAILDEAARGLDRAARRALLRTARRQFAHATLFFVTHDVSDTLDLDRIVVLEGGRIVEQAAPRLLRENGASRYRALLRQDAERWQRIWAHPRWRHVRMERGGLEEQKSEAHEWTHV